MRGQRTQECAEHATLTPRVARAKAGRAGLRTSRGQSMVEFALLTPLFLFMLFMVITFAMIGQVALAVSQLAYSGARYAALNPQLSASQTASYIKSGSLGSPTITGSSDGALTVSVNPASGYAQPVTVTVSYSLTGNAFISGMSNLFSALGMGQTLPTTLTASETMLSD